MHVYILWILVGFVLLTKGADFLVDGATGVAKRFHIPEIVIGLTIVSIGTSLPEFFVSLTSSLNGYTDMAIGNAVGSNISNLFLILGLSTIIRPIKFKRETKIFEIPICLFVTIITIALCNLGQTVTKTDGIILIFTFILFIVYTMIMAFKGEEFDREEIKQSPDDNKISIKDIMCIIIGIIALKIGGDLTVNNAVSLAQYFNLSEKIISVTILAIGTSLPELATNITSLMKKKSDIAIGNILGSNILNLSLIIGTSAIINPISYNLSYNRDMAILTIGMVMLALFPIIPKKDQMGRGNGIMFFCIYVAYIISLFFI